MSDENATPTTPSTSKIIPFVSAFLAMANGRKGLVVILAIALSTLVYLKEPAKLTQILAFLGVLLPAYFASQAYEDGKKQDSVAASGAFVKPGQGETVETKTLP